MDGHIWRPEIYRRDSNPGSNRGWPIIARAKLRSGRTAAAVGEDVGDVDSAPFWFAGVSACGVEEVLPMDSNVAFYLHREGP